METQAFDGKVDVFLWFDVLDVKFVVFVVMT